MDANTDKETSHLKQWPGRVIRQECDLLKGFENNTQVCIKVNLTISSKLLAAAMFSPAGNHNTPEEIVVVSAREVLLVNIIDMLMEAKDNMQLLLMWL